MKIRISRAWLSHPSICDAQFIESMCGGRCCQASTKGLSIIVLPEEEQHLKYAYPNTLNVEGGYLQGERDQCPFQDEDGLCGIHSTNSILQPLGCVFSPFKLNKNNTLIVKHRHIFLPCFRSKATWDKTPTYITFTSSLQRVFGRKGYQEIRKQMETEGSDDFNIDMPDAVYQQLVAIERLRNPEAFPNSSLPMEIET